ncbi:MAG TPA: cytochrome c3 family protein [Gammaproteobacteria bacterium]
MMRRYSLNVISARIVICLALYGLTLVMLFGAPAARAADIEQLVMPGKLIKGHEKYEKECTNCHSSFSKKEQKKLCADCHEDIKKDINSKQGFHGRNILAINQECRQCHTDHIGRDADIIKLDKETFNHSLTDFELKGMHKRTQCGLCHKSDKKYREALSQCFDCHEKNDPHDGKLGKKCESCHSENAWQKIKFDHDKTKFPLKGKHKDADCQSCHPDNRHKNTPKQCFSCHALDDAHNTRYGEKCETCHNSNDWKKAFFDHDKKTKFPLQGRHKQTLCGACHTGTANIYKEKPDKTCFACHKSDDIHKGKNGEKCEQCHSPVSWKKSKFSHDKDTKFPLKGKHEKLQCNACHQGDVHKNKLKTDCLSCHKADDVHGGQQGKQCHQCHNENSWKQISNFNHDLTSFPLNGQHAILTCEECHSSNKFKDTSMACYSCHAKNDEHKQTLGRNCHKCHNPNSWSLWLFDHNKQTAFELDGAHKNLKCSACHTSQTDGDVTKSSTCATCHFRDDVHRGGFGKFCEQCHNTSKFSDLNL